MIRHSELNGTLADMHSEEEEKATHGIDYQYGITDRRIERLESIRVRNNVKFSTDISLPIFARLQLNFLTPDNPAIFISAH